MIFTTLSICFILLNQEFNPDNDYEEETHRIIYR